MSQRHPNLWPEFHADTVLIDQMGFKKPSHRANINDVLKGFSSIHKQLPVIGIVDNDKKKKADFAQIPLLKSQNGLFLRQFAGTKHFLIIHPNMEIWLLDNCREVGLDIKKHGFPAEVKALGKVLKKQDIEADPKFKNLLNDLFQKNAPGFATLKNWIVEILPTG